MTQFTNLSEIIYPSQERTGFPCGDEKHPLSGTYVISNGVRAGEMVCIVAKNKRPKTILSYCGTYDLMVEHIVKTYVGRTPTFTLKSVIEEDITLLNLHLMVMGNKENREVVEAGILMLENLLAYDYTDLLIVNKKSV